MKFPSSAVFLFVAAGASSLMLAATASAAGKWVIPVDEGTGSTEFVAVGNPTAIRIRGTAERPKGKLTIDGASVSGTITVPVASFDSGLALRNQHMKQKYMEVDKYPDVAFSLTSLGSLDKVTESKDFSSEVPFDGKLKIHGVEKGVQGKAKVARKGDSVSVAAAMKINIRDFNIEVPTFAGVTVTNDVDIKVEFTAPMRAQ
ncbi:MAG: YceI family protein [Oligoflexia bacterium]|nr:YceI family protein [Oligoflexia bacterium]